jgi:hypothetical protein
LGLLESFGTLNIILANFISKSIELLPQSVHDESQSICAAILIPNLSKQIESLPSRLFTLLIAILFI